jgi:hypothetical protein
MTFTGVPHPSQLWTKFVTRHLADLFLELGQAHCRYISEGFGSFPLLATGINVFAFSVAAKLRIIHSVIRPVLEYGMEVWGPPKGSAPRKRKRGDSRPGQSFWLFVKCFLARVRATSLICDTLRVCGPRLSVWTPRAAFP